MNQFDTFKELGKRGVRINKHGDVYYWNPNYFPRHIKDNYLIIFAKDKAFYVYDEGVWEIQDDNKLLKELRDIFQEPMFGIWKPSFEKDYMVGMERELYYEGELNSNKKLMNLINGMYDIEIFKLIPHDPKYFSTIRIPIELIPDAKCPRFLKFLDEIFQGDEERKRIAQEWAGYALTTETNAQKALILVGEGENGKGVFVDTLSELIGKENISNIPLNELSRPFSRVKLHNKTANISGENEMNGKTLETQYFKACVGEDAISAEEKHMPVFSFKPTAKMIMTMNSLPDTRDTSYGYFRRLSILAFNANFSGEKRDNKLKEKLKEELPGIFLWAMEGLRRLRANDYRFSPCKSMDEMLKRYQTEQKPMYEFFEDCIAQAEDTSHREDNKLVYNTFKNWAIENGIEYYYAKMSSQKFWSEFEAVAKKKGYKCSSGRSNTFRYHTGIKVVGEYKAIMGINPNNKFTVSLDDELSNL
ncbi:DNA primase family protein [Clostridium sp. YIM B02506]|uniref:DNA primase family protein n=1 Tax=Clostridium sp. YIM B02506 TaxID=2910680 RepID=UPI001EEECFD2|nr:DNA primase family protein [Clostridium sp. YIM B02506]